MTVRLPWLLLLSSLLVLSACGSDVTPEGLAPAPWFTIGKGPVGYTALDTSRIQSEGSRRIVWVRTEFLEPDSAPRLPGAVVKARETRHALDCGVRRVTDLETILRDSVGKPLAESPAAGVARAFEAHPYGPKMFPTVCNAISITARHREQGR
ncbi:surface-adhesin E family protein [Longimicrobium sp.]|uniref:surface-adhesin E family protein n=1 Tax=Longimicrobium sp. TaxID=2029185 RepID=UPI002F932E10